MNQIRDRIRDRDRPEGDRRQADRGYAYGGALDHIFRDMMRGDADMDRILG